jgi:hypothetical protein
LPQELRDVVDPVLQRNGYFRHPEDLLLSMISDDRKAIRELGLHRILKARAQVKSTIRVFTVPQLNLEATDYIDLIDWKNNDITEPPLIADLSNDEIRRVVESGEIPMIEFPRFPCHTQAVERCVKVVTEASVAVCGATARDGFIRSRLESRKLMQSFNTKSQYRTT